MTVHDHTRRELDTQQHGRADRAIARVVRRSLAVGAVSALVLSLVVFPGGTEAVVTGSVLVGFGIGWTVLALASARWTEAPQSWARVPALAMATTGVGLVALSPGDEALSVLTAVWPPALLALVVWIRVHTRRGLPAPARRPVTAVLVVLAAVAVGGLTQRIGTPEGRDEHPAPGRMVAVGDRSLHLDCRGTGTPTVVLVNGMGEISASWAGVVEQASKTTRVCAYDRAGQGWSDDASEPQDAAAVAADLHALLEAADEPGPYVLVGHSIGGPYALTYAAAYPRDVAGMVLLDSSSPRQLDDMPAYPVQHALMRRGVALLPTLARVGLGPVIGPSSDLPGEQGELVEAMGSTVRAQRYARDEVTMIPRILEQSQALTTLDDRPLVVLTASENLGTEGWPAAQDRLAALSSDSVHRTVHSSHVGLVDDPDALTASAKVIAAVARAVRSGSHVAGS